MKRTIPDLNHPILAPLIGKSRSESDYLILISKFERKFEESIRQTLSKVAIQASTKTIPESLPWNNEITTLVKGETWIGGAYDISTPTRSIIKKLLNDNIWKLRFYQFIEIDTTTPFGEIIYNFRYYLHK